MGGVCGSVLGGVCVGGVCWGGVCVGGRGNVVQGVELIEVNYISSRLFCTFGRGE